MSADDADFYPPDSATPDDAEPHLEDKGGAKADTRQQNWSEMREAAHKMHLELDARIQQETQRAIRERAAQKLPDTGDAALDDLCRKMQRELDVEKSDDVGLHTILDSLYEKIEKAYGSGDEQGMQELPLHRIARRYQRLELLNKLLRKLSAKVRDFRSMHFDGSLRYIRSHDMSEMPLTPDSLVDMVTKFESSSKELVDDAARHLKFMRATRVSKARPVTRKHMLDAVASFMLASNRMSEADEAVAFAKELVIFIEANRPQEVQWKLEVSEKARSATTRNMERYAAQPDILSREVRSASDFDSSDVGSSLVDDARRRALRKAVWMAKAVGARATQLGRTQSDADSVANDKLRELRECVERRVREYKEWRVSSEASYSGTAEDLAGDLLSPAGEFRSSSSSGGGRRAAKKRRRNTTNFLSRYGPTVYPTMQTRQNLIRAVEYAESKGF